MDFYRWLRNQWDRALAVTSLVIGAIALLLGWVGISGAKLATQQIPYIASGGLVGIFALGIAATLWLSADLRDEWRKLDEIQTLLRYRAESEVEHDNLNGEFPPTTALGRSTTAREREV